MSSVTNSGGPVAVAVEPECWRRAPLVAAVEAGGGRVVPAAEASALIWAEPATPELLPPLLHDGITWVQLPYAGIEPFLGHLDDRRVWTCGKGVYARPVAELALTLGLAGMRRLDTYVRTRSWSAPLGTELVGARVTVVGGGGIAEEFLRLLAPWRCDVTVVRLHPRPMDGAAAVVGPDALLHALTDRDLVVVAAAATPDTADLIGANELAAMGPSCWLVNVARGSLVATDALVDALQRHVIAGAALDVTSPEPLPDEHPLWTLENCLITPHVGNTPEMGIALLAERVAEHVHLAVLRVPAAVLRDLLQQHDVGPPAMLLVEDLGVVHLGVGHGGIETYPWRRVKALLQRRRRIATGVVAGVSHAP